MFPFRSRALTNSDGQLVTSCAWRSHSVLSTSMRMLQNFSRHPPPCSTLGVLCSPSQKPSSFGSAVGQFLPPTWAPPPPTSSEGGGSSAPSSTPPALALAPSQALHHLQSHPSPLQMGSTGHRAVIPPPPPPWLLGSQIANAHMFVSKNWLWKHSPDNTSLSSRNAPAFPLLPACLRTLRLHKIWNCDCATDVCQDYVITLTNLICISLHNS